MNDMTTKTKRAAAKARPKAAAKKSAPAPAPRLENGEERLQTILRVIEEDIMDGKMLPGQRLDERTLATRFDMSRTPIREVLVRLSSLGIVELRRNHGAFVAAISSGRLVGMLEVMSELKLLAARQAARRMTIDERQRLVELRDEMKERAEKNEIQAYFESATALHDVICQGAHNSFLLETTRNIQVCLCAYRRHLSRILHLPIRTSLEENCKIVDAIIRGDAEEAERWMREQTELRREEFADLVTLVSENKAPEPATVRVA